MSSARELGVALDLLGRKGNPPMAMCRRCDDEPLVMTFEFPGAEFVCMNCKALYGFLDPRPAEETPELRAKYEQRLKEYEAERAAK
jgi:hypothetical protein